MDARILLTDGTKTVKLFWLKHLGSDVHCGVEWPVPGAFDKLTYHSSGQFHATVNKRNTTPDWRAPLSEIKGVMPLTTIQSLPFFLEKNKDVPILGRKKDAVLLIDLRTTPKDHELNVGIGLLERGRFDALSPLLHPLKCEFIDMAPNQALFMTSVNPWIWIVLYYVRVPKQELIKKAVGMESPIE